MLLGQGWGSRAPRLTLPNLQAHREPQEGGSSDLDVQEQGPGQSSTL